MKVLSNYMATTYANMNITTNIDTIIAKQNKNTWNHEEEQQRVCSLYPSVGRSGSGGAPDAMAPKQKKAAAAKKKDEKKPGQGLAPPTVRWAQLSAPEYAMFILTQS